MTIRYHEGDLPSGAAFGVSVAIDTETMGLNPHRDRLCVVQLSRGDGTADVVRIGRDQTRAPHLEALLANPDIVKIFHFARFDMAALYKRFGIMPAPVYCTKIASKLCRTYTDRHGLKDLVRDLNWLYRTTPALHELDCEASGFEWLITDDASNNVFAWLRKGHGKRAACVVAVNFSPNVYHNYRIRVPFGGQWREALNSDSSHYGGSNVGNAGSIEALPTEIPELNLTLPPLAAIFLVPES